MPKASDISAFTVQKPSHQPNAPASTPETTLDLYTQEDSDETRAAQGEFLNAVGMSATVN